jgi:branched-chain amino acid transport system permease protein
MTMQNKTGFACRSYTPAVIGVALVVFMAVLPLIAIDIPFVLPGPTYSAGTLAMLSLAMVYAALALSYNLLLGTAGMLSFGHALYFGAGAYGLGIVLRATDMPLWPGVLIALLGGLVIAVVTGAVAMRVNGIPFAMVTLAFAQAGSVLVRRNQQVTGGEEGLALAYQQLPTWLVGVVNSKNLYWFVLAILIVVYLVILWVERSRLGHLAAATRENELRVRVLGLRPVWAKLIVFVVAGLAASLAGVGYIVLQSGVNPRAVSADLTITVLVMVVLGGVGYRWGAITGAFLFTILNQRLIAIARTPELQELPEILRVPLTQPFFLLGVLFILSVMFLPGGIAGTVDSWRRKRRGSAHAGLESLDNTAFADSGAGGTNVR